MSVTIKDIAAKAHVSIATVSRAINNNPGVTPETRRHILNIAGNLQYRTNILARNFARQKSNLIALILPEISDEFFTDIIKGVDEITFKANFYTIVASSHKYKSLKDEITTFIRNGLISGLILLSNNLNKDLIFTLSKSHLPIVLINSGKRNRRFNRVAIDDYLGAYSITSYLIEKKYKFLSHITGPSDNDDAVLRKNGFIDACKKHKVKFVIENGDFSRDSGLNACRNLLSLKEKPQVVFAGNDMMAVGCYDCIKEMNLQIPEDVGIVGFDDIFLAKYLTPPLTTVRVNIEDIGKKAAELLIRKIQTTNSKASSIINIPTELVIRESC